MRTADLMTLMQWLSPSYPVGAFAYSHGLEVAMADGRVRDAATLQDWLEDLLRFGTGRTDAILLRAAYKGEPEADATARAFAASAERLQEGLMQGAAFAKTTRDVWGVDVPDAMYPVAVGCAAAARALPVEETVTLYLQAFVSNLASAAVRTVPLGQTDGQAVVAALAPLCADVAETTRGAGLDDLTSTAFLSDIAAMRHETLQPRIYRT
ncbi:MAG: urease accessory UreF family protein [Pseudomonadota bacterium]